VRSATSSLQVVSPTTRWALRRAGRVRIRAYITARDQDGNTAYQPGRAHAAGALTPQPRTPRSAAGSAGS